MPNVAIVGIGCRFPGGIDGPDSFWDLVVRKGDGIVEVPADRWNLAKFYDPDPDAPGRMYTRHGGFLTQSLWEFDAEFFGISQREASIMDPQQRLLLEVAWEALDDAGMAGRVGGREVGVFVGGFMNDNALVRSGSMSRASINSHSPTSSSHTLLSARIAFLLDLLGPTMTIDTACSSSLVALHQAVLALESGECKSAIVGGANAMLRPEAFISMCKGRFLAVDGRCKSFDAAADGYGRGEGAGAVVLKTLDAAVRDRDRIYAVVRGSGVNQDGRTLAIPVPNPVAQEALARRVHRLAGIDAHDIRFVEAHGTGTPVGDPLELAALGAVYGAVDGRDEPLPVGSVKNNIGHTEAAAGVAGVIKAALTLHHGVIAPQLRLDNPNPEIRFDELRVRIPLATEPLPNDDGRAAVAVNSFGYGGTNAHAILTRAPELPAPADAARTPITVLPLSARNETALRTMATQLHDLTETAPVDAVTEAAWTQRAHHPLRAAFGYRDADDLRAQLADFAAGAGKSPARALTDGSTQPVFVFSGMGPQWWGMARGLLEADGHFAAAARSIDEIFREIAGWSIVEELLRPEEESRITRTAYAQPANFLVQAALLAELAELGIHPAAVVGHSVGEVASAYASGSLSLRDALLVSYHRARLQATTAGTGGMLAVGLAEEQLHERLAGVAGVCVAAINSQSAATLSGDLAELDRIRAELTEEGVFAKTLRVEVPYHSHLMDSILGDLTTVLAGLTPQPARVPIWSTVTGGELSGPDWDAEYWCRNVREPVRFGAAVDSLLDAGHRVFLEVGPHPVLSGNIKEAFVRRGLDGAAISTLSRNADDHDNLLRAVGELYQVGGLDTTHVPGVPETPAAHLDLPRYPWQRRRLWTEDPAIEADRVGATDGYVMLGQRTAASAPEWEVELSVAALPWLPDHVVDGSVVLPGAAYLDAALSAVAVRTGRTTFGLESVQFVAPLVIAQHDVPVLRLTVEETTHRFTLRSRAATATTWTVNAHGRLIEADVDARTIDLTPAADAVDVSAATLYDGLAAHGLAYGPSFRLITAARVGTDSVLARLDLAPLAGSAPSLPHLAHPAAVDAALQCFAALYAQTAHGASVVVPSSVAGVRWTGPLPEQAVVLVRRVDGDPLCADITVADPEGAVVLALSGVRFASLAAEPDLHDQLDGLFYEPVWSIVDDPATADEPAGGEEFLLVVSLGSTVSQRAKEIASARAASELLTLAPEQADAADRVLATLRAARERPGVTRSRLVVVSGAELDAVPNAYGLALVAKAVGELVVGEEDDAAAAEVRAVVVTEQAFCLPIDAFAHPAQAALTGARRTLRNEQPAVQWRLVDTEPTTRAADIVEQVLGDGRADEVALRAGACWALHLRKSLREHLAAWDEAAPLTDPEASFRLEIPRSRLLSDLAWRAVERVAPGPGEVEIRMDAVGLNYKDALKALGVLTEKELAGTYFGTELGMDGFGVVERVGPGVTEVAVGDEMSVCAKDLVRRHVTLRPDEGATMPLNYPDSVLDPCHSSSVLPFLTAEFAFGDLAHLQPGETVLVHGAAGGMGLAAVQVAVRLGARVIATAGSDERRAVAAAAGAHEVVNSRSISFVDDVLTLTDGRGVDVVYNSSPGEILQQNLRAAAEFGRIIEIGKADIYGGGAIDLRPFDRNLSFFAVDMDRALAVRPELVRRAARRAMDALNDGTYEYLPYTAFTLDATAEAFETVVRSKQIGRVVLDLREPEPTVLAARPGLPIDPAASYLVTGGFGAFGLATARWLVRIGARRLVLAGRSGATTDAARAAITEFVTAGAEVVEERLDMADYDAVAALIERIQAGGHPLRGVFHAAGVVNNLEVPQITAESLAEIFGPKVAGAVNLDTAVTAADIELDMFVLFSSASSIVGISPQFGYAAANSVLDMIAAARRARGAAALAVNWGFMSGGGGMADYEAVSRYAEMTGYRSVDMDVATDLLGECLRLDLPQVVLFDVDWSQWALAHRPSTRTPRFADQVAAAGGGASGAGALRAEILQLGLEQRGEVVAYLLAEQLAAVLGVDAETVDLNTPLPELGMDSLMGMEFGARVVQVLGTQLSVLAVIGLTLRGLGARIAEQIAQEEERAARSEDE